MTLKKFNQTRTGIFQYHDEKMNPVRLALAHDTNHIGMPNSIS